MSVSFLGGAEKPLNPNRQSATLADDLWKGVI